MATWDPIDAELALLPPRTPARPGILPPAPEMPLPRRDPAANCTPCEHGDHGRCRDERALGSGLRGVHCACSLCWGHEAPVDERTALQVMRERAEAAEVERDALRQQASDMAARALYAEGRWTRADEALAVAESKLGAAEMAASGATVRANAADRMLGDAQKRVRELEALLVDAAALIRELKGAGDTEPPVCQDPACGCSGDYQGTAGMVWPCGRRHGHGGRCGPRALDVAHAEALALPGHLAAERREHPSEPPGGWATDAETIANVRAALPEGHTCTDEEAPEAVGRGRTVAGEGGA